MEFLLGNSRKSISLRCLYAGLFRPVVRLPFLFDGVMTAFFIDGLLLYPRQSVKSVFNFLRVVTQNSSNCKVILIKGLYSSQN